MAGSVGQNSQNSSLTSSSLNEEELLDKIFQATELTSLGKHEEARKLFTEVLRQDPTGSYGYMAAESLKALPGTSVPASPETLKAELDFKPAGKGLFFRWSDLSFRNKLTTLLLVGASLPVLILTQVLVYLTQGSVRRNLEESLVQIQSGVEEDYVGWQRDESDIQAATLVGLADAIQLDPRDPGSISLHQETLETFAREVLAVNEDSFPELLKNVRLITDSEGRVVKQAVVTVTETADRYQEPVLDEKNDLDRSAYPTQVISPPLGSNLRSIPIVAKALADQEPLSGVELLSVSDLEKLGLAEQARITPVGSSPINRDLEKTGLVAMAIHPIFKEGELVGSSIVAALYNRHSALMDRVKSIYEIPVVSVFAQDMQISTTLPDPSGTKRALGTYAPLEMSSVLLDPDNKTPQFLGVVAFSGVRYLVAATSLLDHQGIPTGMVMVGREEKDLIDQLRRQQGVGYSIGGGILLLVWLAAFPLASVFTRPIQRLAQFAQRLGQGQFSERISGALSQDEIGILGTEMNAMAEKIEASVLLLQKNEEKERIERKHMQEDIKTLLLEIEAVGNGDLTRRAPAAAGDVGFVGDAFNLTLDSLKQLVENVRTTTERVNSLAQHSESVVQDLAQAAQEQATEMDRALQLTTQSTETIQRITTQATEAADIAQSSVEAAREGQQAMQNTVTLYESLREAVGKTSKKVKHLVGSSQEINKVVSIIKDISDRTSLLAFNAVLEADRAGEQGQGFSLIADEIVELSTLVRSETSQIQLLARRIQEDTSEVAQAMEDSTGAVAAGTQLVEQTERILTQLATVASQINTYQQAIAQETQLHLAGSAEVEAKIEQVNQISAQNSVQATNVVMALRELLGEITQLQQSVLRFRVSHE
jgi:methyl-accepting chemotaxis protein